MASMYAESVRAFLRPVVEYLDDDTVSEILINGPKDVWIERAGKLAKVSATFTPEGLLAAARNMAQFVGRPLSDERPRLDARLPDGSRIHIVLPPIAREGPTVAIRKFFREKLGVGQLVQRGTLSEEMARFLEACVRAKRNIVVAGGTGSGKTTLLNIVSSLIPRDERILTIEDSAELSLQQEHVVAFESRPPDKLGKGEVDMGELLQSALRLRPDRIVVGEVRGAECFHLIQAMNTGHGGSLSTTHANTPVDTLRRLESLCLMNSVELPLVAVRAQVASAVQLVICCERLADGSRKLTHISEVLPLDERGEYRVQDLFVFVDEARDANGAVIGHHAPTGLLPMALERIIAKSGATIDESLFDPVAAGLPPPTSYARPADLPLRWAPSLVHRARGEPDPEALRSMRAPRRAVAFEPPLLSDEDVAEVDDEPEARALPRRVKPASPAPEEPVDEDFERQLEEAIERAAKEDAQQASVIVSGELAGEEELGREATVRRVLSKRGAR